jgi:hypothetical protein
LTTPPCSPRSVDPQDAGTARSVVLLEDVAHQNLPGVPATGAVSGLLTPDQMQVAIAGS